MDPFTIAALIMAVAGAAAQAQATKKGIEVQQEAANDNTREQYAAAAEAERQAGVDAGEKLTDRMRDAKRQLSTARVLAAEGAGGLRGRADNIMAGLTEDSSRIVAGLGSLQGGIRQDMNGARVAAEGRNAAFVSQGQANRTKFLSDVSGAAMGAYASSARKTSDTKLAKDYSADYSLTGSRAKFGSQQ